MRIGVLALQGAFREHQQALTKMGVESVQIKKPEHLEGIDALIIPGGESTTMGKLLDGCRLFDPLRRLGEEGLPILGTCAGLIMLAKDITGSSQPRLGLMDISVERNAFGRQADSFESNLDIPALGEEPFPAVFIRAPCITAVRPGVKVLAQFGVKIVFARQGRLLAAAFHPELTDDLRVHRYFLEKCL
jgi:5'-phosphate synthase pdxT subunit